jgi:hypothetical protein
MENNYSDQFANDLAPLPERPQFLKVLCILSFVACGLFILTYAIGSAAIGMSEETITSVWDKVIASQPQLENVDPVQFFHEVGKLCIYNLLANIVSLIGVIMMWRLNKIGFIIYIVAELSTNFMGLDLNIDGGGTSYGSMIFSIFMDLVFIVMYGLNLKYMNKTSAS